MFKKVVKQAKDRERQRLGYIFIYLTQCCHYFPDMLLRKNVDIVQGKGRRFNETSICYRLITLYQIAVRLPSDRYRLSKCGCGLDEMSHHSKTHPLSSNFRSNGSDVPLSKQPFWKLHVHYCSTMKADHAATSPFTQIPMIISEVGRTALVANLGSPAALILEMQCWGGGKQRRK